MFRHLSAAVIGLCLLAVPSLAAAQDAPPPTAAQIAEARSLADQLIKAEGGGAYFVNVTDGAQPRVRHQASGLICTFPERAGSRVVVFPSAGGADAGDDVGCLSRLEEFDLDLTIYATRYSVPVSAEEVLASAARAIEQRFETARPYEGNLSIGSVEGVDQPLTAAYVYDSTKGPMVTMVLVSHRNGWSYKVRATGPVDDATGVSLMASITLLVGMDVVDRP